MALAVHLGYVTETPPDVHPARRIPRGVQKRRHRDVRRGTTDTPRDQTRDSLASDVMTSSRSATLLGVCKNPNKRST